jgi:ornithine--oxo-acid transaminase
MSGSGEAQAIIALSQRVGAHNYAPLPVVLARAEGVWAWDVDGRRYLDCLSAYSSVNQGHRHPRIIAALIEQANRLTLTSRAFYNDRMGPFLELLCAVAEMDVALPMNTGAEAVETAIKLARKWGYEVKGVARDRAEIIVCRNNFHGRTTTIVGFSTDPVARDGFGPFAAGFRLIDFGDLEALRDAINENTVAFLVEPIQAEAGIIVPPAGFLSGARRLCSENNVLLMLDEIQTGLGRTGKWFAHQHDAAAHPDVMMLGKALGGGVYPVSAVTARREIMDVIRPGTHGSTFGGNPLAAAVGQRSIEVLRDERLAERAARLGAELIERLQAFQAPCVREVRGRGLLVGIEIEPEMGPARRYCERLLGLGVLCKDTHQQVIRLAPPLTLETQHLEWLVERLQEAFTTNA